MFEMKKVGIIGGAGPEASNKFCELLIRKTPSRKDQDNIPFIHFCNPQIPDRTDFILGKGINPLSEIVDNAKALEMAGADFLVVPCNTAHYFLSELQENVNLPIVDMTKVLVKEVLSEYPPIKKIGILATTGSIKAGIYQRYFNSVGVQCILPSEEDQENLVMRSIYGSGGIKAGKKALPRKLLGIAVQKLIEAGVEAVVLGCTEIPLVLRQKDFAVKLYDPMELTAKEVIRYVKRDSEENFVSVRYVLEDFAKSLGRDLNKNVEVFE